MQGQTNLDGSATSGDGAPVITGGTEVQKGFSKYTFVSNTIFPNSHLF